MSLDTDRLSVARLFRRTAPVAYAEACGLMVQGRLSLEAVFTIQPNSTILFKNIVIIIAISLPYPRYLPYLGVEWTGQAGVEVDTTITSALVGILMSTIQLQLW